MSEHKAGNPSFDKDAYWKHRSEGERGQGDVPETVKVASNLPQNRTIGTRSQRRQHWMNFRRQERKGSARGN